jgi:O-antigen/teichoic acid export membrane protein
MTQGLEPSMARVGTSTVVQWAARLAGMLLSLVSLVVVAHRLGAAEYGRLTLATAYFSSAMTTANEK